MMISSQDSSVDKESKRELHDSGRSSPCEDHSSSTGQVVEVKVTVEDSSSDHHRRRRSAAASGEEQRKVTTTKSSSSSNNAHTTRQATTARSSKTTTSIKGSTTEGKAPPPLSLSREAERRAAVLERRRKQEEELKAKMEQLRIRQETRLNRAAATMQMDPATRRAQLLAKNPPKSAISSAGQKTQSASAKTLPVRIQQAVERLSVPKYRKEDNVTATQRMAQSMTGAALTNAGHSKTAKQQLGYGSVRRDNAMSISFNSKIDQNKKKPRAKSQAETSKTSASSSAESKSKKDTDEEIEYKRKLEEKRRLAREKQEQERQRLDEERRKREEEEQNAQMERLRLQEEAIRLEEESLRRAIEEKEKADLEQKEREEQEQRMKAEQEQLQMEEAKRLEEERQARLEQEEEERQMRKKKINDILSSHRSQAVTLDRQTLLSSATESVNLFHSNELISNATSQVLQTYFGRPRLVDVPVVSDAAAVENIPTEDAAAEQPPCLVNGKQQPESDEEAAM